MDDDSGYWDGIVGDFEIEDFIRQCIRKRSINKKRETKMENRVRELRIEIDRMINSFDGLNPSREVSLCYTNLQRSKSWLGMVLGELGTATPYPESSNPASMVIEAQAEKSADSIWGQSHMKEAVQITQLTRVKYFRMVIGDYLKRYDEFYNDIAGGKDENYEFLSAWGYEYLNQSKLAMVESKHWFGWELDRLRKVIQNEEAIKAGAMSGGSMRTPMEDYPGQRSIK